MGREGLGFGVWGLGPANRNQIVLVLVVLESLVRRSPCEFGVPGSGPAKPQPNRARPGPDFAVNFLTPNGETAKGESMLKCR